jgi:hypothetical protein
MPAHAPDGRWLALSDPTSPAPGALRVLPLSGPAAGASRIVVSAELGGARGARWIRRP